MQTSDAILREAESFDRGNVVVDNENYGKGIGIISDPGGQMNFAEFDIHIPPLRRTFCNSVTLQRKPDLDQILINGKSSSSLRSQDNGAAGNRILKPWVTEGVFEFTSGANIVRIQSEPMMSHIDKFA